MTKETRKIIEALGEAAQKAYSIETWKGVKLAAEMIALTFKTEKERKEFLAELNK